MNGRKAKSLRKLAKVLVTDTTIPATRFYVSKNEKGEVIDTLIPMPLEWPRGTFREIYQRLKG